MTVGIYVIECGSRVYVGQSQNVEHRFKDHRRRLMKGTHNNPKLQRAWNLHGKEAFSFSLAEVCELTELTEREQCWADWLWAHSHGFNCGPNTDCPARGKKMPPRSAEHRAKIAARMMGNRLGELSRGKPKIVTKSKKGMKGHPVSEETKAKISASRKGMKFTEEHRHNISLANRRRYADYTVPGILQETTSRNPIQELAS